MGSAAEHVLDGGRGMLLNTFFSVCSSYEHTLSNIPVGELLTGFAMRSDPNVVFG